MKLYGNERLHQTHGHDKLQKKQCVLQTSDSVRERDIELDIRD